MTLVIGTPITFFTYVETIKFPRHSHIPGLFLILESVAICGGLILEAASAAAILGLLRRQSLRKTAGIAAWHSIKTYTWTLLRLNLLIGLIAGTVISCLAGVIHVLGLGKMGLFIAVSFYLVFIKYALADPLVVVEKLMAIPALKQSWKITKGHFWYVGGCYLFLGLVDWLLFNFIVSPVRESNTLPDWAWVSTRLALRLLDSAWIILSWCIYLRIKEADGSPYSEAVPELSS